MIGIGAGLAIAGAASAGGGILSSIGGSNAGKAQADASKYAAQLAYSQYLTTRGDMQPFMDFGKRNLDMWSALPGQAAKDLTAASDEARANIPGPMSQAWLEQQPGYQFTKTQGQKAVELSAASRGLGVSGAAMGAGAKFATGLADQYYNTAYQQAQTRFQDYNSLYSNMYNKYSLLNSSLSGQATLGEDAAANLGARGSETATTISNDVVGAGQATAAGISKQYDALGNAVNSIGQLPLTAAALDKFGGLGNTTGGPPASWENPNTGYTTGGFYGGNQPIA